MKTERTPAQSELESPQRRSIGRILARLGVGRSVKASAPVELAPAEPRRGVDPETAESIERFTAKAKELGADPYGPQYAAGSGARRPAASYRPPVSPSEPYVPGAGNIDELNPFAQASEQQSATPGGPDAWKEAGHPAAPQYKGRGEQ